jgi:hypothetical protein
MPSSVGRFGRADVLLSGHPASARRPRTRAQHQFPNWNTPNRSQHVHYEPGQHNDADLLTTPH